MGHSTADQAVSRGNRDALIGVAGAVLAVVGDVLILGRPCSGSDFDRATGVIPPDIEVEERWRSLWNGAILPSGRIRVGTITGMIGIAALGWFGLEGAIRALDPGALRTVATGSAAAFTLAGLMTHWSCGAVVLAYQQALQTAPEATVVPRISPRRVTRLLGASAVGSLSALAVLSGCLTAASLKGPGRRPIWQPVVTPFTCAAAALATFGSLPAPVGGYARPASISTGLLLYMAVRQLSRR